MTDDRGQGEAHNKDPAGCHYDLENRFIGLTDIIDYCVGEHCYAVYFSAGFDF